MTTAQLAANRANAQLSTGPRTESGKAASSQNARSHGLTARELVVEPEELDIFAGFVADHRASLQPQGSIEEALFDMILHALWNMRRIRRLETPLLRSMHSPMPDPDATSKLDRYARYYQRFERSFHRSLKELRTLQTHRAVSGVVQVEESGAGKSVLINPVVVSRAKRTQSVASQPNSYRPAAPFRPNSELGSNQYTMAAAAGCKSPAMANTGA